MNWKKIIVYVAIVLGFLVLSYAFVPQVLTGKIVNQSDISAYFLARVVGLRSGRGKNAHRAENASRQQQSKNFLHMCHIFSSL